MMGIRQLFHQWTTKTLGGSNKLSVSDYELITDRIHVDVENLKAMELKNTVGQATNNQSQSGPIVGTATLILVESITNSLITAFKPDPNEVWQLYAANINTLDGATSMILKLYDDSTQVVIDSGTSTSGEMELNEPVFITSDAWLTVRTSNASSGNAQLAVAVIRVR